MGGCPPWTRPNRSASAGWRGTLSSSRRVGTRSARRAPSTIPAYSESSRRVSVNRPRRPFTPVTALRPGEDVPIDTNTLDIMCRYADGIIRRAELTMAIDVTTRSILAAIIAPTTKAVDAAAVLARMLVPEPMRPGWSDSLHHAHSVIPHDRLLNIDERFRCPT